jgi:hypothetical protein
MVRICVVCNAREGDLSGGGIFAFPSNIERRKLWLAKLGMENRLIKQHDCVCIAHFDPKYLSEGERIRLTSDAVPNIRTEEAEVRKLLLTFCDLLSFSERSFGDGN